MTVYLTPVPTEPRLTGIPAEPTMSWHEIESALWVTNRNAYWNMRFYREERDRLTQALSDLITNAMPVVERAERADQRAMLDREQPD